MLSPVSGAGKGGYLLFSGRLGVVFPRFVLLMSGPSYPALSLPRARPLWSAPRRLWLGKSLSFIDLRPLTGVKGALRTWLGSSLRGVSGTASCSRSNICRRFLLGVGIFVCEQESSGNRRNLLLGVTGISSRSIANSSGESFGSDLCSNSLLMDWPDMSFS